jgi:hypothetical protein
MMRSRERPIWRPEIVRVETPARILRLPSDRIGGRGATGGRVGVIMRTLNDRYAPFAATLSARARESDAATAGPGITVAPATTILRAMARGGR